MAKVGVIGAGSWGTALSLVLEKNNHQVTLWEFEEKVAQRLVKLRENEDKLPGVHIPESIEITTNIELAVKDKEIVVLSVPSIFVRSTSEKMAPYVHDAQIIVNVSKGIEESTLYTMTQVIEEEITNADVAVLSGPSHAEEVSRFIPTTVVTGAKSCKTAKKIQNIFMNETFRVYTSPDI